MAALMTRNGTRLVLGEHEQFVGEDLAPWLTPAAREEYKVDRLRELRAVIDSLRDPDDQLPLDACSGVGHGRF